MIFKREDIDRYVQFMIEPWLRNKHYKIITACLNGSQGEKFKFDITDGKSIYRFWLIEGHKRIEEGLKWGDYVDYMEFSVYKYELTEEEWKYVYDGHYILWHDENKADVLFTRRFYLINRYQYHANKVYTSEYDEIVDIMRKRQYKPMPYKDEYRRDNISLNNKQKKIVADIIKKYYRGFSTLKIKDIDYMVRRDNRYDVIFTEEYKNNSKNSDIHHYGYIRIKSLLV